MPRAIHWFLPSMALVVLAAAACGGGKSTPTPPAPEPEPELSSEAKVIDPGDPSIGEARKVSATEGGRKAPTMPRTVREDFYIMSPTIPHHGAIPARHTCDGEGISPALSWFNPPKETKSFAIVVDDPDGPEGNFVHWLLTNIPPEMQEIPENAGDPSMVKYLGSAVQGTNGDGKAAWTALCPPPGKPHRLVFRIYAVDTLLELPPGASRKDVEAALRGHYLGQSAIIASYARP